MQVWLDPDRLQSLNLTASDVIAVFAGAEYPGRLGRARISRRWPTRSRSSSPSARSAACPTPEAVRQHRHQAERQRGGAPARRRQASSWLPKTIRSNSYLDRDEPAVALGGVPASGIERAHHRRRTSSKRRWPRCSKNFPTGVNYGIFYNPTEFIQAVGAGGDPHHLRGDAAGACWWWCCSCRPGARRSSRCWRSRFR